MVTVSDLHSQAAEVVRLAEMEPEGAAFGGGAAARMRNAALQLAVQVGDFARQLRTIIDGDQAGIYTVIGVWKADTPVTVGVVAGEHEVSGGDTEIFPEGLWATSVGAEDVFAAEDAAVTEMKGGHDEDHEEGPGE